MWVEEQTYWIALRFLSLGFELDLYSPEEYCMVYWYLYVILVKLAEKTHLKILADTDSGLRLLWWSATVFAMHIMKLLL